MSRAQVLYVAPVKGLAKRISHVKYKSPARNWSKMTDILKLYSIVQQRVLYILLLHHVDILPFAVVHRGFTYIPTFIKSSLDFLTISQKRHHLRKDALWQNKQCHPISAVFSHL